MAAQHAARYSDRDSRRHLPSLPSIKELNFSYKRPPQDAPIQGHATVVEPAPQDRLGGQSWGRNGVNPAQQHQQPLAQQQHSPALPAGHEMSPKVVEYTPKHDSAGFLTPGIPLSAQVPAIPGSVATGTRSDDKRTSRPTNPTAINIPREVRPVQNYTAYHPYPPQPPPSPFHQVPPSPHDQMNHQSPVSSHPGYPAYPQHYPPPRHAHGHPPVPHQAAHNASYPSQAPPPPTHWEHHPSHPPPSHPSHLPPPASTQPDPHARMPPPPIQPIQPHHPTSHPPQPPPQPPQQQQQQPPAPPQETYVHPHSTLHHHTLEPVPYSRTSALVPPPVDTRAPYVLEPPQLSPRASTMSEIVKLCSLLYSFAMRYVQLETTPNPSELVEMAEKANEVVRLLEDLRRMCSPNNQDGAKPDSLAIGTPDDHRPPKRPWEEMTKEGMNGSVDAHEQVSAGGDKSQTTAEQDMEIIRTKRATTTSGGTTTTGQPKSKYRKRSRATPPGKCHSCNIRETPEWRRGPDGARTLCNACGLHYAKLMRKRMQLTAPGAPVPPIDLETLRASARAADQEKAKIKASLSAEEAPSPMDTSGSSKPLPAPTPQHHQSTFQVVNMVGHPEPSPVPSASGAPGQQLSPSSASGIPAPSSPWSSNGSASGRMFLQASPR